MKGFSGLILTIFIFICGTTSVFAEAYIADDFEKTTPIDTTLMFTANDFLTHANVPSGASLVSVRFDQVTRIEVGALKLGGNALQKGNTVSFADLDRLAFVPAAGYQGEAIITWTANYGNRRSPYPGVIVIQVGSKENNTLKQDAKPEQTDEPEEQIIENYEKEPSGMKPLRYEDMLSHWGAYSAGMLASRGIVIGEDYGNHFYFRPDEKITRFDFVLMVNSILGIEPITEETVSPFSDKNVPSYIMNVGKAAYKHGIISGTKETNGMLYFRPYDHITRAEAITILNCALKLESYGVDDAEFVDKHQIPTWALNSVKNLEAYGIIRGYEDNSFRPQEKISRAQAAEIVWQALKFLDAKTEANAVFQTVIYGD